MIALIEQRRTGAGRIGLALIDLGIAQSYVDLLPAGRYGHTAAALRHLTAELRSIREALQR